MKDFTIIEVLIVICIIGILLSIPIMGPIKCRAKWEGSGMRSDWGFLKGCQVEVEKGRWLPEDRLREIDLQRKK